MIPQVALRGARAVRDRIVGQIPVHVDPVESRRLFVLPSRLHQWNAHIENVEFFWYLAIV